MPEIHNKNVFDGLEKAKQEQEHWREKVRELEMEEAWFENYDSYIDQIRQSSSRLDAWGRKFGDYLSLQITVDPKRSGAEMIAFCDVDAERNKQLVRESGIPELTETLLPPYGFRSVFNENPNRIFEIKDESKMSLRDFYNKFRKFLHEQYQQQAPSQPAMEANQKTLASARALYNESKKKVEDFQKEKPQ
jgi:hypothetical protein